MNMYMYTQGSRCEQLEKQVQALKGELAAKEKDCAAKVRRLAGMSYVG